MKFLNPTFTNLPLTENYIKKILILILLLPFTAFSQLGIGTALPNNSSQLDIDTNNKGILIPRVSLTGTTDKTTISNGNVNSLLIFNIAQTNDIVPGYYYWFNDKWNKLKAPETGNGAPQSTGLLGDIYIELNTGQLYVYNGNIWKQQSYWGLTGNSGIDSSTNFIGTTDRRDFIIKVWNKEMAHFYTDFENSLSLGNGTITSPNQITIGEGAGLNGSRSQSGASIFMGRYAGQNQNCSTCIALGYNTLSNGSGNGQTIALGTFAGNGANNLTNSIVLGERGGQNTQGNNLIAIGSRSALNSTGNSNIFIGRLAGQNLTTSSNIVIGNDYKTDISYENIIAIGNGIQNSANNQVKIGDLKGTLYDLTIPKYLNTRNDTAVTPQANMLYTDNQGNFLSAPYFESSILTYTSGFIPFTLPASDVNQNGIIMLDPDFAVTVPLPSALTNKGRKYTIKKNGTRPGIITISSSELIDGQSTQILSTPFSGIILISDGNSWLIISRI